jgi:DNA-binding CsgD family transcriptional regulator
MADTQPSRLPTALWHAISRPALALGLLFAWILSLPLAGPLLLRAQPPSLGPLSAAEAYTLTHTLTLLAAGLAFGRLPTAWATRLGAATAPLALSLAVLPVTWWAPVLVAGGLTTALGVLAVGQALAALPAPARPWAIAAGAFVANLAYMAVLLLHGPMIDRVLVGALALGPLALPWLLPEHAAPPPDQPSPPWHALLPLMPAVFGIYLVGGLMYALVLPTLGPIGTRLGAIPYLVFLPLAAWSTARGRSRAARLGPGMLGLGYVGWALLDAPLQDILAQTLLVGGYAFLDVAFWTTFADHAASHRRLWGLGLGTMTLALFLGMLLAEPVTALAAGRELTAALFAAAALLLAALTFPALWPEPAPPPAPTVPAVPDPPPLPLLPPAVLAALDHAGLTPREVQILELAAHGLANKEIAQHLGLSLGTVRKHLENSYRKLGARSRVEALNRLAQLRREAESLPTSQPPTSPPPDTSRQAMPPAVSPDPTLRPPAPQRTGRKNGT